MANFCLDSSLCEDEFEAISQLCYISQLSDLQLNQNNFENVTKICYLALQKISLQNEFIVTKILNFFDMVEETGIIIIEKTKIFVRNKHFIQLILLCSLKHHQEIFQVKKSTISKEKIKKIIPYFVKLILLDKPLSINALKFLDFLLKKRKDILDKKNIIDILKLVNYGAVSPIDGFKYYGQNLAKTLLQEIQVKNIFEVINLPERGVPTEALAPLLDLLTHDDTKIVEKIIQMFSNNIESRDAGFLYKELTKTNFNVWKKKTYPVFAKHLQDIDVNGEFYESLIKYWIPTTIQAFKSEFYDFLKQQPIDNVLQANALLETRKKGYYENRYNGDLKIYLNNKNTSDIGLKTLCTFSKKTIQPTLLETEFLVNFLYSADSESLDNDQIKSLSKFFSQIFLVAHENLNKNENYQTFDYQEFLSTVFNYCIKCFEATKKELASQVLLVIWDIAIGSSNNLSLNYKNCGYETLENKFFEQCLGIFTQYSKILTDLVQKIFKNEANMNIGSNFAKLVGGDYYELNVDIKNDKLFEVIENSGELASIELVDNVKNYVVISIGKNSYKDNKAFLIQVLKNIKEELENFERNDFKLVLHLEILYTINDDIKIVETPLIVEVIKKCLSVIETILEKDKLDQENFKKLKVVEAFINITLSLLIQEKTVFYEFINKLNILHQMQKIISTSNMKKPTSLAAQVIKTVATSMSKNVTENNQRIQFLTRVLISLYEMPSCQTLTIRKCPETRLILHVLCLTDQYDHKPLLTWTLDYIQNILKASDSPDSAVSSALYCAEALLSDNSLHSHTLTYVPELILMSVQLFDRKSWTVRNAVLQMTKAIIDRFFGVVIGESNRQKSIEDLFLLFPKLAVEFFKILTKNNLTDSSIIVLQYFIESQLKHQVFKYKFLEVIKTGFSEIIFKIIFENSGHLGVFAVRALVSMCLIECIPQTFCKILNFVLSNILQIMSNHTFRNFMLLIKELFEKYKKYSDIFSTNLKYLQRKYDVFISHFKSCLQLDLLFVKVSNQYVVLDKLDTQNFDTNHFETRIWQNNYLPNIIFGGKERNLPYIDVILLEKSTVCEFVQIKIFEILEEIIKNKTLHFQNLVLGILLEKIISTNDSKNYLILGNLKVVLLICQNRLDFGISKDQLFYILKIIRGSYTYVSNIYKIVSFILILSQVSDKTDQDKIFVKNQIKNLEFLNLESEDILQTVSESLVFFYITSNCDCQKLIVLKMAFKVLYKYGFYDFVNSQEKYEVNSTTIAFVNLFKIAEKLEKTYFSQFVEYVYNFQNISKDCVEKTKTYFSRKRLVYVDAYVINTTVLYYLKKNYSLIV